MGGLLKSSLIVLNILKYCTLKDVPQLTRVLIAVQRDLFLGAGHACQAVSCLARGFEQAQQALVDAIEPVTLLLMSSDGAVVIQVRRVLSNLQRTAVSHPLV